MEVDEVYSSLLSPEGRIMWKNEEVLESSLLSNYQNDLGLLESTKCILRGVSVLVSRLSAVGDKEADSGEAQYTARMVKKPKICILGAGFSGMCAGIKLKGELGYDDFTIYDKNEDFGGTWLTQTYPGCACDVPSHLYSFSFEPNPDWTSTYARQPEILAYIKRVATKYNLYSKAKFCHKVETARWNEITKKWLITVCNLETSMSAEVAYDYILIGTGPFGNANIPDQFLSFKGPLIHSSKWDPNVDLDGKVVAVVGSGASAVQIIPQIVTKVQKLISFQRRPAWVTPLRLYDVPSFVRTAFRWIPGLLWLFRIWLFMLADMLFLGFKAKSYFADFATWGVKRDMKKQILDPELREKLLPDYRFGCKRITPSNSYFKSLTHPNCEVVRKHILSVEGSTITTEDGREYNVDVMILATGYRVQDLWSPLDIRGRSRSDVDVTPTIKARGVPHYLGIVSSELPNAFVLLGPNTAYGHNTVLFPIECQVNWIVTVLKEMQEKKFKLICVKKEVEEEYRKEIDRKMKDLVWGAYDCGSWYVNSKGINTTVHPGSAMSYWRITRNVDFSKFELE